MHINLFLISGLYLFFSIILPTILIFTLKSKPKILKIITIILLISYLCVLFISTTFQVTFSYPNFIIQPDFNHSWFSMDFILFSKGNFNILLNLIMFLPIGPVVFTLSKKHKFLATVLTSLFLSIFIETIQFILPINRQTELFDILLNTTSGLISGLYCMLLNKIKRRP